MFLKTFLTFKHKAVRTFFWLFHWLCSLVLARLEVVAAWENCNICQTDSVLCWRPVTGDWLCSSQAVGGELPPPASRIDTTNTTSLHHITPDLLTCSPGICTPHTADGALTLVCSVKLQLVVTEWLRGHQDVTFQDNIAPLHTSSWLGSRSLNGLKIGSICQNHFPIAARQVQQKTTLKVIELMHKIPESI